nr:MAG TPA: hypothetical protein [Caudoviricetes sp.]
MINTQDKLKVSISNLSYFILEIVAILVLLGGIIPLFFSETKMSFFSNILDPVIFIPAIITAVQTIGKKIKILAFMGYSLVSIIIIGFFYEHLRDYELNLKVMIYFWYISLFYVLQRHIKKEHFITNFGAFWAVFLVIINIIGIYSITHPTQKANPVQYQKPEVISFRAKLFNKFLEEIYICEKVNKNWQYTSDQSKFNTNPNYLALMQNFDQTTYKAYVEYINFISNIKKNKDKYSVAELEKNSGIFYSNCSKAQEEFSYLYLDEMHTLSLKTIFSKKENVYDNQYIFEWCLPIDEFSSLYDKQGKEKFMMQQKQLEEIYEKLSSNKENKEKAQLEILYNLPYKDISKKYNIPTVKKEMIAHIALWESCKNFKIPNINYNEQK